MPMFIPLAVAVATSASWVAIAGAALYAVGGVTENKTLQNIGSIVGLAGSFASLAGGAAAGASEAGGFAAGIDAADAAAGVGYSAMGGAQTALDAVSGASQVGDGGGGDFDGIGPTTNVTNLVSQAGGPPGNQASLLNPLGANPEYAATLAGEDAATGAGMTAMAKGAQPSLSDNALLKWFGDLKPQTQATLLNGAMKGLQSAFGRDVPAERLDADKAELERRQAAVKGIKINMTPRDAFAAFPNSPKGLIRVA